MAQLAVKGDTVIMWEFVESLTDRLADSYGFEPEDGYQAAVEAACFCFNISETTLKTLLTQYLFSKLN